MKDTRQTTVQHGPLEIAVAGTPATALKWQASVTTSSTTVLPPEEAARARFYMQTEPEYEVTLNVTLYGADARKIAEKLQELLQR